MAAPFLPAIVWSVAGAVVTHPLVHWVGRWIRSPRWRASVAIGVVAVVILAPAIGLSYFAANEIAGSIQHLQDDNHLARWQQELEQHPRLAVAWQRVSRALDLRGALTRLVEQVRNAALTIVSGSAYSLLQAVLTLFILFYLYRDEAKVLHTVRQLAPLTDRETDRLLARLGDTIHATILGTLVIALVKGLLGGLIFWILGIPAAVLWGSVMGVLSIIPYLGSFVVWAPAALFLLLSGSWIKALVLTVWGMIVLGLIDNLLYPILVGNRLHQHTVVAFLAIVGGIAVFGAAGIVLGPVVVSLTVFLLEVWRRRTSPAAVTENPTG
jgi:predicted PurR-regulated permease PerM